MSKTDGGPAFPVSEGGDTCTIEGKTCHQFPGHPGMSLRDWFAGMAINGLLSGDSYPDVDPMTIFDDVHARARCAYEIADAMLAERAKEKA